MATVLLQAMILSAEYPQFLVLRINAVAHPCSPQGVASSLKTCYNRFNLCIVVFHTVTVLTVAPSTNPNRLRGIPVIIAELTVTVILLAAPRFFRADGHFRNQGVVWYIYILR